MNDLRRCCGEVMEEIRAACGAATPGPWAIGGDDPGTIAVDAPHVGPFAWLDEETHCADAELMAQSREWLPALVDEVEQLRADLQIANERGDAWRQTVKEDTVELERLRAFANLTIATLCGVHGAPSEDPNCSRCALVDRARELMALEVSDL